MTDDAPSCPSHTRRLVCPACLGQRGGRARSKAKTAAARQNIQARWTRAKEAAKGAKKPARGRRRRRPAS